MLMVKLFNITQDHSTPEEPPPTPKLIKWLYWAHQKRWLGKH